MKKSLFLILILAAACSSPQKNKKPVATAAFINDAKISAQLILNSLDEFLK